MQPLTLSDGCATLEDTCRRLLRGRSRHQLTFCRRYLASHSSPRSPCLPATAPQPRPATPLPCSPCLPATAPQPRPATPLPCSPCLPATAPQPRPATPLLLLLLCISVLLLCSAWPHLRHAAGSSPCLLPNNFALMEATRPASRCDICSCRLPVRLSRPSRAEFAAHAYRGRPVLVSGAAETWPARRTVDLRFLRHMYARLRANASLAEDGCQFLAFRSPLESLQQLMEGRVDAAADGPPWYIGWSNCDPRVAAMLRGLYSWPDFLPKDGEGSAIDWIFMGTPGQGTAVHIDNVHRPSWQAQIRGSKRWRLFPPPECEHLCRPFTVDVHPGDIFLLDTNQWYHGTEVVGKEMSITIGSEYD